MRIAPFRALIFDSAHSGPLERVVAPPYDLIDQAWQAELYARSPYNVVRLELNRDADPYASAAATLVHWIEARVVETAARPAIYFYTQTFQVEGRRLVRSGMIAHIRLEEFKDGRILPHERTFPKAKEDRLRLLTATRVNVSPIFGLYPSGDTALEALLARVARRAPMIVDMHREHAERARQQACARGRWSPREMSCRCKSLFAAAGPPWAGLTN